MVTIQPKSIIGRKNFEAMPYPGPVEGALEGFEYLASLDQLIFKEEIGGLEAYAGIEMNNKVRILNNNNQQIYYAAEQTNFGMRAVAGPHRGFKFYVYDQAGQVVMMIERQFLFCMGGCVCCVDGACYYAAHVFDKYGRNFGIVRQTNSKCSPQFSAFDVMGEALFKFTTPNCECQGCCCTDDMNYPLFSCKDGSKIGNVVKPWVGCCKEMKTDLFNMTFPRNINVNHKALLLALLLYIDLCHFHH